MVTTTESSRLERDFILETPFTTTKPDSSSTPRNGVIGRPSGTRVRNPSSSSLRSSNAPSVSTMTAQQPRPIDTSYGTDPSNQTRDSDVLQNQKAFAVVKRRWLGLTEILFNVLGTFGFVVGSLIWVLGTPTPGTLIFAGSCVCCGISCTIYAVKFYGTEDYIGVYALMQQTFGCAFFTTSSFFFIVPDFATIALIGFFAASLLFLTGCLLTQIQCRSFRGCVAPLYPGGPEIIPTSLLNTLGSVLFTVGSVFLFYTWGQQAGAWCYEVGSIVFFFASWGDATIWWKLGLTQSEHQQQITLEDEYAAVKFL